MKAHVSPLNDPAFFPIAVWLQSPTNALAYKKVGVNLFVGLWGGPTEDQLAALKEAGMPVICAQNDVGMDHLNDPMVLGWAQDDEPDNAQPDPSGGYGPPVDPSVVKQLYTGLRTRDPSRPVYLNLGQGVAWHDWIGRGSDTGTTYKYPAYAEAADILSFDIYPANTTDARVRGKLSYVGDGVANLREWSKNTKPVWCWIETTKISDDSPGKPTPAQVQAEVWMAIANGAQGIGYFCHSWSPSFVEAGPLGDPAMLRALTKVNAGVSALAPVLNSPTLEGRATTASAVATSPVRTMVKHAGATTYAFAVNMGARPTGCTLTVQLPKGASPRGTADVLHEGRKVLLTGGGTISDTFAAYECHIYSVHD